MYYSKTNCTFTVRVTVSPITSLSIFDNTDMTPSVGEILNRPSAVESVDVGKTKTFLIHSVQTKNLF